MTDERDEQQVADDQLAAVSVAGVVVDAWREHLQDPTLPATGALPLLLDLMCPAIEGALAAVREQEAARWQALPDVDERIAVLTDRIALLEAVMDRTERVARDLYRLGGKYESAADEVLEALGVADR